MEKHWTAPTFLSCSPESPLHLPFLEQDADELGIQAMAAFVGDELAGAVAAGKRQVAEQVERLVPDAFVFKAKRIVDRPFGTEDQQVLVRDPRPKSPLAEPVGFFLEEEGAGRSELLAKAGG